MLVLFGVVFVIWLCLFWNLIYKEEYVKVEREMFEVLKEEIWDIRKLINEGGGEEEVGEKLFKVIKGLNELKYWDV